MRKAISLYAGGRGASFRHVNFVGRRKLGQVKIRATKGREERPTHSKFPPRSKDEHQLRNEQTGVPQKKWRFLLPHEIRALTANGNACEDWDKVLVSNEFDPSRIRNNSFSGLVRVGRITQSMIEYNDSRRHVGITNSRIVSCDIGDDCAVHDVHYLAHYLVGNRTLITDVDDMHVTRNATFGNGGIIEASPKKDGLWIELINESGGRAVQPFDGMLPADAYLWARFRDDAALQQRFIEITQAQLDTKKAFYGTIGEECVIRSSRIITDAAIGSHCLLEGVNRISNVTIRSREDSPTRVIDGVELVDGILGCGSNVLNGCKAMRFVLGENTTLKNGARLLHCVLGDNSTISCCEVLHNLLFPSHEQHHNNSFLIASLVGGQSNLAAGATVGSNHNSRANDGEIMAGRGFWPGLSTSLKHSSRFASFTLIATGTYPYEISLPLPFSLISSDPLTGGLRVMPAYWWLYNMYALMRNTWKFRKRDGRKAKLQNIEFEFLAPDTVEEIFIARELLEVWTAEAYLRDRGTPLEGAQKKDLLERGRALLTGPASDMPGLVVGAESIARTKQPTIIQKPRDAYRAYGQMLLYYAVTNLLAYHETHKDASTAAMAQELSGLRQSRWENVGGQIIAREDLENILKAIREGTLDNWESIHSAYDELWEHYPGDKCRHAFATLQCLTAVGSLSHAQWTASLDEACKIQEYVRDQVRETRAKDFENTFRHATFRNPKEMEAVVGTLNENDFVRLVEEQTAAFRKRIENIKESLQGGGK
ncbi:MAG: DUF4954 family protein [Chitinivibrionales bacterium]|nr:DUF4954 family protein [Chitinivibrionales bacterium]MBD3356097.1 DUF4954 family protein [Chitinivibrionales bacterium]